MNNLIIQHISTGYGCKLVIDDLTLQPLPRGKVIALLGPNGSGKSTLMRAIAGLNATRGEMWLGEQNLLQQPFAERAKQIVYLPQSLPQGVHLRVLESIIAAQRANYAHSQVDESAILQLLEQLGITQLSLRYLDELSGGQKQLVGLAQSLIRQPQILLLDEPLSALDLNYQFHVMQLVKRETVARQMITIIVVHDINIALRHADYIVMLKQGRMVAEGEPKQVITAANLAEVYGVLGRIESCSKGYPQIIVDGLV